MCLEILFWYKHHFLPPEEKEKQLKFTKEILNELNNYDNKKKK
jgi:hypothetical protein